MDEFPFGHNHHHHHRHHQHRGDRDDEEYPPNFDPIGAPPPPPPPVSHYYGEGDAPPPQVTHVYHSSHGPGSGTGMEYPPPTSSYGSDHYHRPAPSHGYNNYSDSLDYPTRPPPPQSHGYDNYSDSVDYPTPPPEPEPQTQPPQVSHVQHVSHDNSELGDQEVNEPHHYRPHLPSFIHSHIHHQGSDSDIDLADKAIVRVFCKADPNYSLTVQDGKVILARSDPSDPFQHWIKDEKFSTKVKDEEKFPSFALVNKATGLAMKHSTGATQPVQLIPYNPNILDESILWTASRDLGDGFRTIRMVNNIRLNVDAFNGDKNHGGVRDGTIIVLWEWKKGDNQRWKIIPY